MEEIPIPVAQVMMTRGIDSIEKAEQFLDLNSRKIWSLKPENRVIDSLFLMAEKILVVF